MLAGYIAIWATEVNGDNPEAADSSDDNDTPDTADINDEPAPDNTPVTDEPNDDTSLVTCEPNCDTQPAKPAKLIGGTSNCVNVEATAVDVV